MIDEYLDQAIYNSYQVLTGWMTMDEVIEHCEHAESKLKFFPNIVEGKGLIEQD